MPIEELHSCSVHVSSDLKLSTRAFAAHIPFIPVGRTKECQECGEIFAQLAIQIKKVPLTTIRQEYVCGLAFARPQCNFIARESFNVLHSLCTNASAITSSPEYGSTIQNFQSDFRRQTTGTLRCIICVDLCNVNINVT